MYMYNSYTTYFASDFFFFFKLGATVYQALCVLVASEIVVYYVKKYVQKIVSKTAITDEDIAKILRATDHQKFTKAVEFLKSANRKHPSLYKRLELGNSWDEVIVNIITNCYGWPNSSTLYTYA